ncbi:MAG: Zn-dependent oligopeptidase [Terracidiphilus sp.]|nr:Zn-dependent oligopeptidase [Terracidiphilus sp.]
MKTLRIAISLALLAVASSVLPAQEPAASPTADTLHGWLAATSPEAFEAWTKQRLAAAKADMDRLVAVSGPRTVENTLRPFDDAQNELSIAGNNAYLLYSLADGAALRDKGQALSAVVSSAQTDLNLNQSVYKALAAIPSPANPAARHYLERSLLEYRLNGVDRDEATRKKIHALQDKITDLTLAFGRNVADGTLKVAARPGELEGLPADYISAHKPGADGTIALTTDEPDVAPVMSYAKSAALRARMYTAYHSRAYPKNEAVLRDLLTTRQELASTLGYAHYADLATADQMMGSAANVEKLIGSLDEASRTYAVREYSQLLAFAQKQQPDLKTITMADRGYWWESYRRSQFGFDAQSVRPYFPYAQVQNGILQVASRFFRVEFKPAKDAQVWDNSVDAFDVYDAAPGTAGRKLGRIYLDMHPREGKDKWFSASPVIPGIAGRQLPEAMLVCNFSGGKTGEPGLMQYDEVVTFFHEFGHLMHNILGGQGAWSGAGGFGVEGDFVESPSQMLEEVFHSASVLQTFGKHYQTGAVLPAELIARMNAASAYGRGQWVQRQLIFTSFSLGVHNQAPAKLDFDKEWSAEIKRYSSYPDLPGTHDFASFTHLTGYASNYYTYVLDKVIAIDFFAQFDRSNLLDGPAALRYRKTVLEPGATKPAAELVKDFLGRPQAMDAFRTWMGQEFEEPAK